MSELRHQKIIDRVHYMYLQTDGTIEFPNSFEGDLLKIAYGTAVQSIKQPQLNENQQIVLEWLKEEQTKNPELTIFGTLSVLFDESENRFMSLDVIDALNDLSNSQQAGVFQGFSQWALEQEEE